MNQVAIIIPTMDNRNYLGYCLASLLNNTPSVTYHVYVVNNGEPGSCDWTDHPTVTVIEAVHNLGWEGALQMGLEASEEPLVLFLNDDTVFFPKYRDWLARLVADLDDWTVGAAGPSSNYVSGPQSIGQSLGTVRLSARYLIGFCMLVRRSALEKVGGVHLGSGADDIDLSIRLRQAGYALICDRTTFVYHYGAKTGERVYGSVFGPGGWYGADKMAAARDWLIARHGQEAINEVWGVEPLEEYQPRAIEERKEQAAMHIVSTELKDIHTSAARTATICLCMMVRNEAEIIERALRSAMPWVDAWSIIDTGSTDDTPALVAQTMGDLPGKLSYADWVDFSTNRSAAFRAAQEQGCDYVLIMDADQTLAVTDPNCLADLTMDGYNIDIHHANLVYPHPWLLKSDLPWRWERSTHEYLACDAPYRAGSLAGLHLVEHADSYRRKTGAKMTEDYALLQAAYDDDPTEPRTVFYLAQACADLGKLPCALRHYRERVRLGGWIEEVWCAQYRSAKILETQNNWEAAINAHLVAFAMCPDRAEPLYRLGKGFLMHKQFAPAALFFREAAALPLPTGKLFVEAGVYEYQALWGLSMAHRLMGQHAEATELENKVLKGERTPARVMADIISSRSSRSIGSLPG